MTKLFYPATILLFCMGLLMSCGPKSNQHTNKPVVGADKDEHGCIASAGYSWSELLQECIRPFEKGVRLNSTDEKNSLAAYLVFNADSSKVEVFLPGKKNHPILSYEKSEADEYSWVNKEDDKLSVKCIKDVLGIYINGQLNYKK